MENGVNPPSTADLDLIRAHASLIRNQSENLTDLEDRLSELEDASDYLLTEIGQEGKYRAELTAYIQDLREELAFNRRARKVFGSLAFVAPIALFCAPVILAYATDGVFKELPDAPKAALLASMIAGGVAILLSVTRSVYRDTNARVSDDIIPQQVKAVHDLTKGPD